MLRRPVRFHARVRVVNSGVVIQNPLTKVPYKWIVASVFVMALFIDILDLTAVNVSLVSMSSAFKASVATTTWVVLGYSLSLAVWIPVSGWVGDRFGTKHTFMFEIGRAHV